MRKTVAFQNSSPPMQRGQPFIRIFVRHQRLPSSQILHSPAELRPLWMGLWMGLRPPSPRHRWRGHWRGPKHVGCHQVPVCQWHPPHEGWGLKLGLPQSSRMGCGRAALSALPCSASSLMACMAIWIAACRMLGCSWALADGCQLSCTPTMLCWCSGQLLGYRTFRTACMPSA